MPVRWLCAIGLAAMTTAVPGRAADLVVVVDGVRNDKGDVEATLYASAVEWPDGKAAADLRADAKHGEVVFTFRDLAPGTYAITAFHDENRNGKLDTNVFGFPLEGFAFSNDVHPFLASPSFKAAAFPVGTGVETITIHMQYLSGPR
jgi:uncharacterized protein (DUF2141 family)